MRPYCNFPGLDQRDPKANLIWKQIAEFLTGDYLNILQNGGHHCIYHHDDRWIKPQDLAFVHGPWDDVDSYKSVELYAGLREGVVDGEVPVSTGRRLSVLPTKWTGIPETVQFHGFDQITTISQDSINRHFLHLWHVAHANQVGILIKWSSERFEATFGPINLRLLTNNRAVFWVHLATASLQLSPSFLPSSRCVHYHHMLLQLSLMAGYQ